MWSSNYGLKNDHFDVIVALLQSYGFLQENRNLHLLHCFADIPHPFSKKGRVHTPITSAGADAKNSAKKWEVVD